MKQAQCEIDDDIGELEGELIREFEWEGWEGRQTRAEGGEGREGRHRGSLCLLLLRRDQAGESWLVGLSEMEWTRGEEKSWAGCDAGS